MKTLSLLLAALLFAACHNRTQKNILQVKKAIKHYSDANLVAAREEHIKKKEPVFTNELLKQYQNYTDTLNKSDIESSHLAAEKFLSMFSNSDQALCDSAYYIFDQHYLAVNDKIDSLVRLDTTIKADSLLIKHPKQPISAKLAVLKEQLARNGYMIYVSEGDPYIGLDEDFLAKWFYSKVSPTLKTFLIQENKENKKVPTEDASIIISPQEFVSRLVWWESFNRQYGDFLFANRSFSNEDFYLTILLSGIDNDPLVEFDSSTKITDFYKTAAAYLQNKYPLSPSASIIPAYYKAIANGQGKKIGKSLLLPYLKIGVLTAEDIDSIINSTGN